MFPVAVVAANPLNGFSSEELTRFRNDGFAIVRGMAGRELCESMKALARAHLAAGIQPLEYEAQVKYPGSPASLDAPGGKTVRRLLQACARDPLFRDWATSAQVACRLHQLLGDQVELSQSHHNCIMTKNPAFSDARR